MTAWTIRGRVYGQPVAARWSDGHVSLSDPLEVAVRRLGLLERVLEATPTGPYFPPGLDSAEQAYVTVRAALDVVSAEEGDVPRWPLAPGVVA